MAVHWECIEGAERRQRLRTVHGWVASEVFRREDIVCGERAIKFVPDILKARIRAIPQDFFVNIQDLVREMAPKLVEDIVARVSAFVPNLNPSLRSALLTLKTVDNLTASELIALNSVIGGASIRNEFDIEAFYAREDEVSR